MDLKLTYGVLGLFYIFYYVEFLPSGQVLGLKVSHVELKSYNPCVVIVAVDVIQLCSCNFWQKPTLESSERF